jgi:Na+-translocating ferredoxin:NAD+ oxidoreductase subunit E
MNELMKGIWKHNPVLYLLLGLCPALAVTNTLINALAMSVVVFFVLVCSNICVLGIRGMIPPRARIPVFLVIVTTLVTMCDIYMKTDFHEISKALGPYLPLAAVNCVILSRMEGFFPEKTALKSILGTLGMGLGFTLAMLLIGGIRELAGSGSLAGYNIMGADFQALKIMLIPAGAFLTLGILAGIHNLTVKK